MFLLAMDVIPLKKFKEDRVSSYAYHENKIKNTLKLPK